MRKVNNAGIQLIKSFEGFSSKPYPDPGTGNEPVTIGYGTTIYDNGIKVTMSDPPISQDRGLELLQFEIDKKATSVATMVKVALSDNEFAALSSFSYNVGSHNLETSTLLRLLNAGTNRVAVADQFLKWDKAGGKVMPGLTRRRQAERALFLQPDDTVAPSEESDIKVDEQLSEIENFILKS